MTLNLRDVKNPSNSKAEIKQGVSSGVTNLKNEMLKNLKSES
jgi:hypothetical protein